MGIELVEGQDLFVQGDFVYMRTTEGPKRVDVIYRRIDDAFLDPLCFRPDSMLGVPGLMNVYRSGGVAIASAPGAGVADDKAVYTYVPEMIRFYLGEQPILKNVQTWKCADPDDRKYVLENLKELVVKEVHGSGGYGMLVGPKSTKEQIAAYAERIKADPSDFIAQPTLALSTCPTFEGEEGAGAAARRPAPVLPGRPRGAPLPRRPDPGGAERGLAGGQLEPGRRGQGHLGAGGLGREGAT